MVSSSQETRALFYRRSLAAFQPCPQVRTQPCCGVVLLMVKRASRRLSAQAIYVVPFHAFKKVDKVCVSSRGLAFRR